VVVNWLKHYNSDDLDSIDITEFEAVMFLLRAITKFIAVYHQSTRRLEAFLSWAGENGYPPKPPQRLKAACQKNRGQAENTGSG
jgi:hypothetical protein